MRKTAFASAATLALALASGATLMPSAQAAPNASGTIVASSQLNATLLYAQENGCKPGPAQGGDGWLVDATNARGISVYGRMPEKVYDLNVFFIDGTCKSLGYSATREDEIGIRLPAGTRYVFIALSLGAAVKFDAYLTYV